MIFWLKEKHLIHSVVMSSKHELFFLVLFLNYNLNSVRKLNRPSELHWSDLTGMIHSTFILHKIAY